MQERRVGFVGTGVMGLPMARNVMRAGFSVTVHNRTRSRAEPLLSEGAAWADTPAALAAVCDVVVTCVSDTPDMRAVVLGPAGIAEGALPGATVIDMSTISPSATRDIAERLGAAGVDMLDAPVSGGQKGAVEGTLSIMVGGKAEVLERCRPVLDAMGTTIVHCGHHGQGQMVKLCNQIAIAVNVLAAAEALTFARKAGLDLATVIEAVGAGSAGSWAIKVLGPRMASRDFAAGFMVKLQLKDLRLVMQEASELGVPLAGAAVAQQLFTAIQAEGGGDDGTQALVRAVEKLAGL